MYLNAQTIPGRDIRTNVTIDRITWLRRYLEERKAFNWTAAYKANAAELAALVEAK